MLPNGTAIRLNTYIDIPIEIGLPHFIQDDQMKDEGPLYGNFKLSLQSVVCHRGDSVDSGHYISLVKGTSPNTYPMGSSSSQSRTEDSADASNHWMRFDDLASERITLVDIEQALKDESPYLLFYQILPIESDAGTSDDNAPPSYANSEHFKEIGRGGSPPLGLAPSPSQRARLSRPSLEITVPDTSRAVDPATRQSVAYSDSTGTEDDTHRLRPSSSSAATTPKDDDGGSSFSFSRRGSKRSKGGSQNRNDNQISDARRISATVYRLAGKISRDKLVDDSNAGDLDPDGNGLARSGSGRQSEKGENTKQLRKRDRSKGKGKERQKHATLSKGDKKPDRECVVM